MPVIFLGLLTSLQNYFVSKTSHVQTTLCSVIPSPHALEDITSTCLLKTSVSEHLGKSQKNGDVLRMLLLQCSNFLLISVSQGRVSFSAVCSGKCLFREIQAHPWHFSFLQCLVSREHQKELIQAIWNLLLIFFLHTVARTEYDGWFLGFVSFMHNLLNDGHIQCSMRQPEHIYREQMLLFSLRFATGSIIKVFFFI